MPSTPTHHLQYMRKGRPDQIEYLSCGVRLTKWRNKSSDVKHVTCVRCLRSIKRLERWGEI